MEDTITPDQLLNLVNAKIDSVSFDDIREDITRCIPDESVLDILCRRYFKDLVKKLKFK